MEEYLSGNINGIVTKGGGHDEPLTDSYCLLHK